MSQSGNESSPRSIKWLGGWVFFTAVLCLSILFMSGGVDMVAATLLFGMMLVMGAMMYAYGIDLERMSETTDADPDPVRSHRDRAERFLGDFGNDTTGEKTGSLDSDDQRPRT
jgi:tetrahydromethanopterin S-methyltransferase subunit D